MSPDASSANRASPVPLKRKGQASVTLPFRSRREPVSIAPFWMNGDVPVLAMRAQWPFRIAGTTMRPSFTTGAQFVDLAHDSNAYHMGPLAGGTTVTSRA